jgi:hypothetical protein
MLYFPLFLIYLFLCWGFIFGWYGLIGVQLVKTLCNTHKKLRVTLPDACLNADAANVVIKIGAV